MDSHHMYNVFSCQTRWSTVIIYTHGAVVTGKIFARKLVMGMATMLDHEFMIGAEIRI